MVHLETQKLKRSSSIVKKPLVAIASALFAAAALTVGSSAALASPRVDWSISIGAPGYYQPAPYVQPYGVYGAPAPVYAAPVPAYGDPYYAYREREWREREWRRQQWREHHWREMQWRRHHMHGYGY